MSFNMHVRFNKYEQREDNLYFAFNGGPAVVGTTVNVDATLTMREVLKAIAQKWNGDRYKVDIMEVITPIRDCELDMTPSEYVAHSHGLTKKEHQLYQGMGRGIDGTLRINFTHDRQVNRDESNREMTVHLTNRKMVFDEDTVFVMNY